LFAIAAFSHHKKMSRRAVLPLTYATARHMLELSEGEIEMTTYTKTETMKRRGELASGDIINDDGVMIVVETVEIRPGRYSAKDTLYAALNGETDPLPADFEHTLYVAA
jgi:hypothetical protein